MCICSFFGNSDCPNNVEPVLREVIIDLIENKGVDMFFTYAEGNFNRIVQKVLWELEAYYYDFDYYVVSSSLQILKNGVSVGPSYKNKVITNLDLADNFQQYAIDFRDNYILKNVDYVVCYNVKRFGVSAELIEKASKQKKIVINLADFS